MDYRRLPIEIESPEELGYDTITNNLSESSCADMTLRELGLDGDVSDLVLQYGDHLGLPRLREQVVLGDPALTAADVLVTAGAAPALFIVATALLRAGDHLLVVRPNYATNLETPRALGADVEFLDLRFEDGWALDLDRVATALRPDTRLVSITLPHNPTGTTVAPDDLRALVALVERHGRARLLVDETYREMAYAEPLPLAAGLSPRVIGVSSLSKTYGLPGLRTGWITCADRELMVTLLAAKEQILLAGSIIDEELSARVLEARPRILPPIRDRIARHRAIVADWIDGQDTFEWVAPQAGVVCFPRVRAEHALDPDRFYDLLLREHGTYVGPGHWFAQDRRAFRLGFGWPAEAELRAGLDGLLAAAGAAG
jgi:aspartate/methionine/tyrosine aminotransferase